MAASPSTDLVPVSVIGGYLGAGKTTLVNRLLAGDHGRRLAVLVNDFGSINVDADLIAEHGGDTISLANGCICCAIGDSLGDGLDLVLEGPVRPDQIVIEASGVADPAKIASYGLGWPGCRLDAVVVLADVETITARSVDKFVGSTVLTQLAGGDLIVLTKTDLVTPDQVGEVVDWLAGVVPGIPTVAADHGALDWQLVLDGPGARPTGEARPGPGEPTDLPPADQLFATVVVDVGPGLDRDGLEAALADGWPPEVVRVKGLVELAGERVEVHRVGNRWSITPADARPGPSVDRLVFVIVRPGPGLAVDRAMIDGPLRAAGAASNPE